ncbi:tRNA1(Val) (adenine(37)-N6)-methyltransferase [Kozakia baliensis]|uniref:Uncharacterized protein n=1 Tax=Kozakia baliensis TaxID=153496 RepID=A0A1D8US82_9PROT|nr:hypothetical protein [Kozakia baliensis]AOX16493.1 hypothetical protein A0U89_04430 [Kozakia baliensis]AOX19453.1 hypothetical protein A0U90_03160 [Kozakia baliensis]GBR29237.1 methyltransferase [Kozakia baliensis NRIC 0488]GEL63411.1 hypothetical protein KBA01_06970 [Kozakia baliensis]
MSGSEAPVNPSVSEATLLETTSGTLLGGRIVYHQFTKGYRTGIEPVLLAAFVPAKKGDHVLEAGSGAGAGLLCLSQRIADISGIGLEADTQMAEIGVQNFLSNRRDKLRMICARVPAIPKELRHLAPGANGRFHHALANPPWHPYNSSRSPDSRRSLALSAPEEGWHSWIGALARWVLPGGTLNLALPTTAIDEACIALRHAGCGSIILAPLWPKAGRSSKIALLRATLGGRSGFRLTAGLVLHEEDGRFTPSAEAVLRHGMALAV